MILLNFLSEVSYMAKFRTQYDDHARVFLDPGSRVKTLYSPIYDDQGVWHLEESGKEDLYGYIQSHAMSVDINVLLKQYQLGDIDALQKVQGTYGDFTQAPKTFAEALNVMIAAEQYFLSLPVETRAVFHHNLNEFIASMDSPDWTAKAGITPPEPVSDSSQSNPGAVPTPLVTAGQNGAQAPSQPSASPSTAPA